MKTCTVVVASQDYAILEARRRRNRGGKSKMNPLIKDGLTRVQMALNMVRTDAKLLKESNVDSFKRDCDILIDRVSKLRDAADSIADEKAGVKASAYSPAQIDRATIMSKLEALLSACQERGIKLAKVTVSPQVSVDTTGAYSGEVITSSGWNDDGIMALSLKDKVHFVTYGGSRIQGYLGLYKKDVHSNEKRLSYSRLPDAVKWVSELLA